ncbi:hypothetical protein NE235_36835, partial [Actinoallomurus spadix]|nr:hypothetical protein [Actinoallomurus spadix]
RSKQEEWRKQDQDRADAAAAAAAAQQATELAKQEKLQKEQQEEAKRQYEDQKQQQDLARQFFQPQGDPYQLSGGQLQPSQIFTHSVHNPDGTVTTTFGDGSSATYDPQTGLPHLQPGQTLSHTSLNPDGTITTDYSDGTSTTINPHTGLETTTHPDGSVTTEHLTGGHTLTNPDGSQTTVNPDGTITTHNPDGSVTTINPRTGSAVTHEPNGELITTPLGPRGTALPGLMTLPGGTGLGGTGLGGTGLGGTGLGGTVPGLAASPSYEEAVHDLPSVGNALGSPSAALGAGPAATDAQGGYPMGGGGMGGLGGMGAGDKNNSGERVRQVYDDEDIIPADGGLLGRRARKSRGYEEPVPASRTATSSGYDPYGGEEHQQTQSGERERETWLPEEEDVWGTDEGGAPAVIG